jgi:hypothetical protein
LTASRVANRVATSTPLRRDASVAVLLIEVLLEDRFGRSTELVKFFYFV